LAIARQRIELPPRALTRALGGMFGGSLWEGEFVERLESAFAEFIGAPAAVAVPSGRAGLRFTLDALELAPGSQIICSAFGYPVVPHIAKSLGYDVRFADCELETLGMDPAALEQVISDRTKVVIATHLYGVPCRIDEIAKIAEAHGAILIEDCAHCFGASVAGKRAGAYGTYGYFSFETSKPINTLGGGMVTMNDPDLARRVKNVASKEPGKNLKWLTKRLAKTAFEATVTQPLVFNLGVYPALRMAQSRKTTEDRFASGYHSDEVTMAGRLGRYTNYQAGLGLAQMETVKGLLDKRVHNARLLIDRLTPGVHFQTNNRPGVESNFMLVTALFPRMEEVAAELLRRGVDTKHHYMRDCSKLLDGEPDFPLAVRAENEILHLPAYPTLGDSQIDRVAAAVEEVVHQIGLGQG